MEVKVIRNQISTDELKNIARVQFHTIIKAVVDVEQEIIAIGGDDHEDEREFLMTQEGSKFENLWGIDIYPERRNIVEKLITQEKKSRGRAL